MKTFDQCKDEVANNELFDDWIDFFGTNMKDVRTISRALEKAAEFYAQEVAKEKDKEIENLNGVIGTLRRYNEMQKSGFDFLYDKAKSEITNLKAKHKEIAKDALISFGTWYSGMTKDKVERAYERYLKEVKPPYQPNQEKP